MKNYIGEGIIEEEGDTEGSWAISYGDMITLLLTFFVIFFSFDYKKEKEQRLQLGVLQEIAQKISLSGYSSTSKLLTSTPEEFGLDQTVSTVVKAMENGDLSVFFPGVTFFLKGSTVLSPQGQEVINKFLSKYTPFAGKYKIKILCFTDATPVSTGRRYQDNIELSALRSVSVLKYMKAKGIPLERIELGGKGVMNPEFLKDVFRDVTLSEEQMENYSRTVSLVLQREDMK